jgi:hypothetical protein
MKLKSFLIEESKDNMILESYFAQDPLLPQCDPGYVYENWNQGCVFVKGGIYCALYYSWFPTEILKDITLVF